MNTNSFIFTFTATVWAVAAGTAVFWLLQWTASPGRVSADLRQAKLVIAAAHHSNQQVDAAALATLLGHANTEGVPAPTSHFTLWGVVAQAGGGAALLSLDDQPARPYGVGSRLGETTFLQSIGPSHVTLGSDSPGSAVQRLDLSAR